MEKMKRKRRKRIRQRGKGGGGGWKDGKMKGRKHCRLARLDYVNVLKWQ